MKNELSLKSKKVDIVANNLVPEINNLVTNNLQAIRTKEIHEQIKNIDRL